MNRNQKKIAGEIMRTRMETLETRIEILELRVEKTTKLVVGGKKGGAPTQNMGTFSSMNQ
jgi:hypothetical protein